VGSPPLHPDLEPLRGLAGSWRGLGAGSYPTIDPFEYREEVTFGHVGKPFLAYSQKTRHAETDLPLHAETGYVRLVDGDGLEVLIAQPTGLVEVLIGSLDGHGDELTIDLRSSQVVATPTAKSVTEVLRRFELRGDELRYEMAMAAVGQPMTHHLAATLRRVPAST
jgi:hypothetical protein